MSPSAAHMWTINREKKKIKFNIQMILIRNIKTASQMSKCHHQFFSHHLPFLSIILCILLITYLYELIQLKLIVHIV